MLKHLTTWEINGGTVAQQPGRVRLTVPATRRGYVNAQLDDYHRLARTRFPAHPPYTLNLRARASHAAPVGTFGFGLWNDPFSLRGGVVAAPNCIWFFYAAPPNDMALVDNVPGWGWKAATLNSGQPHPLWFMPAAGLAAALTRVPGLGAPIMAFARGRVRASECLLTVDVRDWHDYRFEWQAEQVTFWLDEAPVLVAPHPPAAPLGLVIWMDNQFAVASRAGRFEFGVSPVLEPQWLEVETPG